VQGGTWYPQLCAAASQGHLRAVWEELELGEGEGNATHKSGMVLDRCVCVCWVGGGSLGDTWTPALGWLGCWMQD
jgi:hypothetical protein